MTTSETSEVDIQDIVRIFCNLLEYEGEHPILLEAKDSFQSTIGIAFAVTTKLVGPLTELGEIFISNTFSLMADSLGLSKAETLDQFREWLIDDL